MDEFIPPLEELVEAFRRLPGVGRKSAERMAFGVLSMSEDEVQRFSDILFRSKREIRHCAVCSNISSEELCPICSDNTRNRRQICVVEDAKAVISFEKLKEYKGVYHVLGGVISPRTGVSPSDIAIPQLISRVESDGADEIIVATNATVEGETTALYISRLLKPYGVKLTRLAYGIPVGGALEYADKLTLLRAIEGRREL